MIVMNKTYIGIFTDFGDFKEVIKTKAQGKEEAEKKFEKYGNEEDSLHHREIQVYDVEQIKNID